MAKQIINTISHTYEINKSKFICFLCPYHKFDEVMAQLKEDHPKGRHFVYAYRHLNEFDQVVENQSDDGEPKGSSGPPTLAVLRGEELVESAAIIVRYFGGIKLGVGGLVRAYGKSVHLALEVAERESAIQSYIKQVDAEYKINIQSLGKLEHFLKSYNDIVIDKEFLGVEVVFKIRATESQHLEFDQFVGKLAFT
jgi:uncharacterized YigZ family protein